ncbi:hypothetical protein [Staphylococcus equorum]|uniref:Uncharacterized protein n=1 Tax=Staphylococcus equorum TaxID=246432 RepID=A0AAP7IGG6_9STAP|nr:hypothetical protein [Staphylococcus equorum]OEK58933.1 hypothetical protein ASS94_01000 [Staphylococcus equorum]
MVKMNNYFTDVNLEEYDTMFDFYVQELEFNYIVGNYSKITSYLNQLEAEGNLQEIIEGLKCNDLYILYINKDVENEQTLKKKRLA